MAPKTATKPRKAAVQARSQATVDALLRATARILVREGYDRASTNKIAALAGVSVGSLYQYFPSKEALVASLIQEHVQEMAELVRAAAPRLSALPLAAAVREAVHLMVAAHALDPKLHRVLVEQVPRIGGLGQIGALEGEMLRLTRALLEGKRSELVVADLDLAAFIVMNIIESLTHAAVIARPDLLAAEFEEEVALAVIRYLCGGSAEPAATRARATPELAHAAEGAPRARARRPS
ncbi:MAG: Transcriptional regulator, TetR family [Myxococcaceae bacterium]|nr:Transcriptional regulator, TetR family [Myxococcaceae bacterium]